MLFFCCKNVYNRKFNIRKCHIFISIFIFFFLIILLLIVIYIHLKNYLKKQKEKKNDVPLMDKEGEGLTRSCFY